MKVFVTGGSGFVGRNLINALAARGDEVFALARSEAATKVVEYHGASAVRGSLEDDAALARGVAGCDAVFHAAAKVSDWGALEDFLRVNVEGTERVLAVAESASVGCFVHISTEAVLVDGRPIIGADESWPLPDAPLGPYAISKGRAEQRVRGANGEGFRTVVVRPRFIWGKDDTSVLPRFIEAVASGGYAWIGGGRYRTSTCHVDNVVEGALLACEKGRGGETYFLSDGDPVVFRDFIEDMLATRGIDVPDRSLPAWAARGGAYLAELLWRTLPLTGNPPLTRSAYFLMGTEVTVNDGKARHELGYQGHVTIADGLAEMRRLAALSRSS